MKFKPDFIQIPFQLIEDSRLTPIDRILYGVIYWLEHLKDGKCTAGNKALQETCQAKSIGTIQNCLNNLEDCGYIKRLYKDDKKKIRKEIKCVIAFKRVSLNNDKVSSNNDTQVSSNNDTYNKINNNIINNNNISSKELTAKAGTTPFSIGEIIEKRYKQPREDINEIIDYFKGRLGGSLDGTQQENRNFCKLLIDRIKKDYPKQDSILSVKQIIDAGLVDDFHKKNCTNMKYIYRNALKILQSFKSNLEEMKPGVVNLKDFKIPN